jgi:rod shape-determining protein MreD
MSSPQYILLPVNPIFIFFSIAISFVFNLLPWGGMLGVPDFLAITLVFWCVHQPRTVGMGVAFFMGLLMDVHEAIYLGENALTYTLLCFFAISIHRRVLWFPVLTQTFHVLPLFFGMQLVELFIRFWIAPNAQFPGWMYFIECLITTALWPLVTWLLLAPQRRAIDKDFTRPI